MICLWSFCLMQSLEVIWLALLCYLFFVLESGDVYIAVMVLNALLWPILSLLMDLVSQPLVTLILNTLNMSCCELLWLSRWICLLCSRFDSMDMIAECVTPLSVSKRFLLSVAVTSAFWVFCLGYHTHGLYVLPCEHRRVCYPRTPTQRRAFEVALLCLVNLS